MTADERRSAHLVFDPELADGLDATALEHPAVLAAVESRRVPSLAARVVQRRSVATGRLTLHGDVIEPMMAARRAVLGRDAHRPPRLLVRADEVPHVQAADDPAGHGTAMSRRFHEVLHDAGVPYLAAVLPLVPTRALEPDPALGAREHTEAERELLLDMRRDGVVFGLHALDHRTRHRRAFARSELTGLREAALEARLTRGAGMLRDAGLHAPVFVPPFNRFSRRQWPVLARHFDVVCGGPESVPLMGWHRTPLWRGDAVWFPSYAPLYAKAADLLDPVQRLIEDGVALWLCVSLHPGWEAADDFAALERLASVLSGATRPWDDFLTAVDRSKRAA